MKPLLVYDETFRPAEAWVADLAYLTGDAVRYCPQNELHDKFPEATWEVPAEDRKSVVHYLDEHGTLFRGAAAIFEVLSLAPRRGWLTRLYYRVPPFADACDNLFEAISIRRKGFSALYGMLWGHREDPITHHYTHWFFLRMFAFVILIAFASLWYQIDGLAGDNGIAPAAAMLAMTAEAYPDDHTRAIPTLMWLFPFESMLTILCAAGVLCAVLALAGFLMPLAFLGAGICYLSLINVCGPFLRFQWDILLIEMCVLAVFFSAWRFRAGPNARIAPSVAIRFLLRWLLFRICFSSGIVKLGDTTWTDLRAFDFHFWTQPLPHLGSWYAHQMPDWAQPWAIAGLFFVYLVVPFFFFAPRRLRSIAGQLTIALQLAIIATGNHGFFNLLILTLCISLFDDLQLTKFLSNRARTSVMPPTIRVKPIFLRHVVTLAVFAVIFPASLYLLILTSGWQPLVPERARNAVSFLYENRVVSTYGLYATMSTQRPEIIIEGTRDGVKWEPYVFRWKPGPLDRAPRWAQPHMPRLDWQLAYAALGTEAGNPWFTSFLVRLLENEPSVTRLLDENPFEDEPPIRVRAQLYTYAFVEPDEHETTGNYWVRSPAGIYSPEMELGWQTP